MKRPGAAETAKSSGETARRGRKPHRQGCSTCPDVSRALHDGFFRLVHGNALIYNACWEDPRIDRRLMRLDSDSRVVMITSAGCNALDYALDGPAAIHCVDVNFRQNALLELKLALFRRAGSRELYALFGEGGCERREEVQAVYEVVRADLPDRAREFWDTRLDWFERTPGGRSFYYRGAAGRAAWLLRRLVLARRGAAEAAAELLESDSLDRQRSAYAQLEPLLWGRLVSWLARQPAVMAMLGVPRPQIGLIDRCHPGGLGSYLKDKLRHVMTEVEIGDNYFWRAYLTGGYKPECSPEYLRPENFELLRARAGTIRTHTCALSDFLRRAPGKYTHFILLDHQDWLADHMPEALAEEWELILANSAPGAKVLLRSAGADASFLPDWAGRRLRFFPELTDSLHAQDRVGTYGSLHFAEIA